MPATIPVQPTPRGRGHWRRSIVAAVAVVVVAELLVRWADPYLPAPDLWADQATAVKVTQLDAIGARGCVDVVFAGSSMARDAFDPGAFSATDPARRSAYNAALDAASPPLLERWLLDQVLPRAHPATVVLGLASFDLNQHASLPNTAFDAHRRAPSSARGAANRLEAWFTEELALVRHRAALRDPDELVRSFGRWRRGEKADRPSTTGIEGVLAPDGHGLSRRALRYRGDTGVRRFVARELLNDFELSEQRVDALTALVDALQRQGIEVVLVPLPVTRDYVALHPRGDQDQAEFLAAIASIATRTGAIGLEVEELPERMFADTHHVNGAGSRAISTSLPADLHEAGAEPIRC